MNNYRLLFFITFIIISGFIGWSIKDLLVIFDRKNSLKINFTKHNLTTTTQTIKEEEKFMTYLPHSGLHNQRIALINALIISKALNRTLLMPDMNIGTSTYWAPYGLLSHQLDNCTSNKKKKNRRRRNCHPKYEGYKSKSVQELFDLTAAHALDIKTEQRLDMKLDYITRHYLANHKTVPKKNFSYQFNDTTRYNWQFFDNKGEMNRRNDTKIQFLHHIGLDEIKRDRKELYLEFGSLFGNSRLVLNEPELIWTREYLHREIGINHRLVNQYSQNIIQQLGQDYKSIHLRQGDGMFARMISDTIKEIQYKLSIMTRPQDKISISLSQAEMDQLTERIKKATTNRLEICKSIQYLNIHQFKIIYVATDSRNPQQQFQQIFQDYPCLFVLNDFVETTATATANAKISVVDHSLLPMIDAEIGSRADLFIAGTPRSTFSAYIRNRNHFFRLVDFF